VKAAEKGKTLASVALALKTVVPLRDLELAATGNDDETGKMLDSLVERAHKLMAGSLDDMTKQTERTAERANRIVTKVVQRRDGGTESRTHRRGLDNNDQRELKDTIKTCRQIVDSCKDLAAGFAKDDEPFDDLEDVAKTTAERANEVLTDNYSELSN